MLFHLFDLDLLVDLLLSKDGGGSHFARQHEGQLLGDGRHRAVWPLQRDPFRPHRRPGRSAPGQHGRSQCPGGLEPGLHPVQPVRPRVWTRLHPPPDTLFTFPISIRQTLRGNTGCFKISKSQLKLVVIIQSWPPTSQLGARLLLDLCDFTSLTLHPCPLCQRVWDGAEASAQEEHRHWHGSGAPGVRPAEQDVQLWHRPLRPILWSHSEGDISSSVTDCCC